MSELLPRASGGVACVPLAALLALGVLGCEGDPPPVVPKTPPCGETLRYADAPRPAEAPPQVPLAPRLQGSLPAVEAYLAEAFAHLGAPALAAGIVTREGLFAGYTYGVRELGSGDPLAPDDVFRIGSVTKPVTGLALLRLRDSCKLDLDDPLSQLVPEAKALRYPTRDSAPLTLRNLVTHTAGLARDGPLLGLVGPDRPAPTDEAIVRTLRHLAIESAPGVEEHYSNYGTVLEGLAIARASGLPYREYVTSTLLAPLGMTASTWEPPADPSRLVVAYAPQNGAYVPVPQAALGAACPGGGLFSTLPDLARFLAFELSAWPPRDEPDTGPVRRSSVRESHGVAGFQAAGGRGVGVHWIVEPDCLYGRRLFHSGTVDGHKTSVYFLPEVGVGVVLYASARVELDPIAKGLLHRALDGGMPLSPALASAARYLETQIVSPNAATLPQLFGAGFFPGGDTRSLAAFFAGIHASAGVCDTPVPVRLVDVLEGELFLPCARTSYRIDVRVTPTDPPKIASFQMKPVTGCDPP